MLTVDNLDPKYKNMSLSFLSHPLTSSKSSKLQIKLLVCIYSTWPWLLKLPYFIPPLRFTV